MTDFCMLMYLVLSIWLLVFWPNSQSLCPPQHKGRTQVWTCLRLLSVSICMLSESFDAERSWVSILTEAYFSIVTHYFQGDKSFYDERSSIGISRMLQAWQFCVTSRNVVSHWSLTEDLCACWHTCAAN